MNSTKFGIFLEIFVFSFSGQSKVNVWKRKKKHTVSAKIRRQTVLLWLKFATREIYYVQNQTHSYDKQIERKKHRVKTERWKSIEQQL